MTETRRIARLAGLLYLVVVLAGPFIIFYVPGRLFVPGDPSATVQNILANESLFQVHIVVSLIAELCFIGVALVLYRLLKSVSPVLASLMVILVLIDAPLAFLNVAHEVATLSLVRGAEVLVAFDQAQRDALATLLMSVDRQGGLISELFWGLWLFPLGMLVYRSGFIPRFLGIWLIINGAAYLVISATGLVSPQYHGVVSTFAIPTLFGEVALMLWLLIARVRGKPEERAAAD